MQNPSQLQALVIKNKNFKNKLYFLNIVEKINKINLLMPYSIAILVQVT